MTVSTNTNDSKDVEQNATISYVNRLHTAYPTPWQKRIGKMSKKIQKPKSTRKRNVKLLSRRQSQLHDPNATVNQKYEWKSQRKHAKATENQQNENEANCTTRTQRKTSSSEERQRQHSNATSNHQNSKSKGNTKLQRQKISSDASQRRHATATSNYHLRLKSMATSNRNGKPSERRWRQRHD